MEHDILSVSIAHGYNGILKARAILGNGEEVVLDLEQVKTLLVEAIKAKGFSLNLAPAQKLRRLVIAL